MAKVRLGLAYGAVLFLAAALFVFLGRSAPASAKNGGDAAAAEFAHYVHPTLTTNCAGCHNPNGNTNPVNFLKAVSAKDMQANRTLWRDVAIQLTNRTMPRGPNKLSEQDRLRLSTWIIDQLRATACNNGDYAGPAITRRLNRREYRNTVRDLLGVDFNAADIFPADGSGGAGFDTNGETLYVSPLLVERYVDAAQQIADRVIVSPVLDKTMRAASLVPGAGDGPRQLGPSDVAFETAVYASGSYTVRLTLDPAAKDGDEALQNVVLKVDGLEAGLLAVPVRRDSDGNPIPGAARRVGARALETTLKLERGTRQISIAAKKGAVGFVTLELAQNAEPVSGERKALHYRFLGVEPGETPLNERAATQDVFNKFLRKAYRRPVIEADLTPLMAAYDRSAQRGDPYEERVKLMLRTVLVSPDFLFRAEAKHEKPGIYPVGQQELATRLSYFLWSTMPDDELRALADQGRLKDPAVLNAQVDRMLNDPRSRAFTTAFVGQWLGTEDLGGRVAPFTNSVASFYNPETAADLRAEPVRVFEYLIAQNRPVLDLLDANYSFLTSRLTKFYQVDDKIHLTGDDFQKVEWPDSRRGGVLGLGAVLALSSTRREPSPVLRGAWTEETLFGTPVPPPPPNIPALDANKNLANASTREKLAAHRSNAICASCHNLMDPIGLGLDNFDWIGRWRDNNTNGTPIDASGIMPSGEKFNGPVELRKILLTKKEDFIRQLTDKSLGYALGRSLQDGDSCTVQHISEKLAKTGYGARTLIHEVVMSIPFRNTQGGNITLVKAAPKHQAPDRIIPCDQDGTCTPLKKDQVKTDMPAAAPPEKKADAGAGANRLAQADTGGGK